MVRMKTGLMYFLTFFFILSFFSFAIFADTVNTHVPISDLYVPAGLNSNDNVEIVVEGHLPNLCYSNPQISSAINGNKISLEVKADLKSGNIFCAMVISPFVQTVSIGNLQAGEYDIVANENGHFKTNAKLYIREAQGNDNAKTYAYIEKIEEVKEDKEKILIKAFRVSDCYEPDEAEVIYNGKDTISVLPTLSQVNDFCPKKMMPVQYEISLPSQIISNASDAGTTKRYLIQAMSADGNTVNYFINR